jgi:hypothetical protein
MLTFISLVVLAIVSATISKVRNTYERGETTNDIDLWHDPLILWPEYFVAAISGVSFLTSLCIAPYTSKSYGSVFLGYLLYR